MIKEKHSDDINFIKRFKAGDPKAYTELYDKMFKPLCYYTYRLIKDDQEAQCIVAETFEKLWTIRDKFDSMPSVRAFLYKVCYREGCDFLKYGPQKNVRPIDDITNIQFEPAQEEDILERMVKNEVVRRIFDEINKLPPQRQKVLQLFYAEGLTTKEVAERLSLEEAVVRSLKSKALADLRQRLGNSINQHQLTLLLLTALLWQQNDSLFVAHVLT